MKVIVCVDNHMGLMFHQRRQSQDRVVREIIKDLNQTIYMNEYSYHLYKDILEDVYVSNDFLELIHNNYCLIENVSLKDYESNIEEIMLFKWNRDYPADFYLDIDLSQYKLIDRYEFEGTSHHITQEIYRKDIA